MTHRSLGCGFLNSAERVPERHALEVDGKAWTYAELRNHAASIAATLQGNAPAQEPQLTAVLAHRSATAFAGILAALMRGHGYVPLNPGFPTQRLVTMLDRSGCRSLIVGEEAVPALRELLENTDIRFVILLPGSTDTNDLCRDFPNQAFLAADDLASADTWERGIPSESDTAYLLFTSGSTGIPKGVQVSHRNICRFIDVVNERYQIRDDDRFSQMFELVFDLSLFDMFVAWEYGACVCCPSAGDARLPAKFIMESKITIWFSVPSLGLAMKKMRMLRPDIYPSLRISLFCGEALLGEVAAAWAEAAPNSIVENLYGPTEVTLACTWYRWEADKSPAESLHGMVPIGDAFPGMTAMVADENLTEVAPGEEGELLMSGPQVAIGYWKDEAKTTAAFVTPPGMTERYYRTGDLVRRPKHGEPIQYLGRIDHQVKIRGNRVELGEIEEALRDLPGVEVAVALGWPVTDAGIDGVTAFVHGDGMELETMTEAVASRLPSYMVPREVRSIEALPLNQNGKIDRKALLQVLEDSQ